MKIAPLYLRVGQKICALRNHKAMSQETLASKAGLNRAYLAHIEGGKRRVSLEVLNKIVNALEISLPELFQTE